MNTDLPSITLPTIGLTTKQVSARVRPWIDEEISKVSPDEEVLWELSVMLMPVADSTPQPMLVLMVWIPSPVLGEPMGGMCPIDNAFSLTRDRIAEMIPAYIRHLREQRSQILASQGGPGFPPGP